MTIIRPFDGSLADAEGLLAVERATFDDSPYTPKQVQAMLMGDPQGAAREASGGQRAWLAMAGDSVAGFVIAFATGSLQGRRWEIDLLAVLPEWRGWGLATRLIRAAAAHGAQLAHQARSVVAAGNGASAHAFAHAGFRLQPETCKLLIYRTAGLSPHSGPGRDVPTRAPGTGAVSASVRVTEVARIADAAWLRSWLQGAAAPGPCPSGVGGPCAQAMPTASDYPGLALLLAEQAGHPAGYAELIEVQTLLYRGVWIESLVAPTRAAREALVHHAVNRAIAAGLDEIGAMVPERAWLLQESLLASGFRSLGEFRWLTADLPLPGLAVPPGAFLRATGRLGDGDAGAC
jgi:ribosomal protein S18 acetylase RimI-like enzyme